MEGQPQGSENEVRDQTNLGVREYLNRLRAQDSEKRELWRVSSQRLYDLAVASDTGGTVVQKKRYGRVSVDRGRNSTKKSTKHRIANTERATGKGGPAPYRNKAVGQRKEGKTSCERKSGNENCKLREKEIGQKTIEAKLQKHNERQGKRKPRPSE